MIDILADIGGTHARVAIIEDGKTRFREKEVVTPYEDAVALFLHVLEQENIKGPVKLHIAAAGRMDKDGIWRIENNDNWEIDGKALKKKGIALVTLVNDFYGSARGAVSLKKDERTTLKKGREDEKSFGCAIMGPGTGLGLAYAHPLSSGKWHIQETYGAHMLSQAWTDEQIRIRELVFRDQERKMLPEPESFASGVGLPRLYRAVCMSRGIKPEDYTRINEMIGDLGDPAIKQTLRLFHEYLGLFAHHAVITGHAYGGVFLDGGVFQFLRRNDLFDMESFEKFFVMDVMETVYRALKSTPVWGIDAPYVALTGLAEMIKDNADA